MAARTSADRCQKVRRGIKTINLIALGSVLLLSGCSTTTNTPALKPAEKIASAPAVTPTNSVVVSKPEPVTPVPPPEPNIEAERNALLETDLSFSRTSEEKGAAQAFYDFFAADGVNLFAGELPIRGR